MKITQLLIFSMLFSGCKLKSNQDHSNIKVNEKSKSDSENNISVDTSQRSIDSVSYLIDYKEEIDVDTTIGQVNGVHINISHTITKTHFVLPSELIFDEDTRNKLIYKTKTIISFQDSIMNINDSSVASLISNRDEQVKKMGVLLLSRDQINLNGDTLILPYSYSIPYTDLGKSITVKIDLKSKHFVLE